MFTGMFDHQDSWNIRCYLEFERNQTDNLPLNLLHVYWLIRQMVKKESIGQRLPLLVDT